MTQTPNEVLNLCLQLSANDKISQKNTWKLPLIDCIEQVLDFTNCDFIKSAGAIQASTKIYSTRVDFLAHCVENLRFDYKGEQAVDSDAEVQQTQRKQKQLRYHQVGAEQLLLQPKANAFYDSNFYQMQSGANSQILAHSELYKTHFCATGRQQLEEIDGLQQMLNKSQRFLEASQLPVQPVQPLQYDANEADITAASYVSILQNTEASGVENNVETVRPFQQAEKSAKVQRIPRPKAPAKQHLAEFEEIRLVPQIAKTQSRFQFTNVREDRYFVQRDAVFRDQNVNKFILSNYRQTEVSRMQSVTELSIQKVHFDNNLTADQVEKEMDEFVDGLIDEPDDGHEVVNQPLSQSLMQNSQFQYIENENLIQQKLQIGMNVITTKFAKRPKQINIQELKKCVKAEVQQASSLDFGQLIDNYSQFHSKKVGQIEDVSVGMMFVGLLHLASESNVDIRALNGQIIISDK